MSEILLSTEYAISRSPQVSNAVLYNFMAERQPPESSGQMPLFGCPGITSWTTAGNGAHRGSWNFNGLLYVVSGTTLYSVASDGTATSVGTGIAGTDPVGMSDNGTQLCIVNGVNGWIYTVAGGLVQITSGAFYPARTVYFMDGYFIFERLGTNEWFLSALYDGLTYNGLDFASAEGQPGFTTAVIQNLQLLFVFCTGHIELWYDAGTASFPFQRYSGGIINYGCTAPYTIIKQDGAIFFLGSDKIFYRLQANSSIRVSTHPIETELEKADDLTNAYCTTLTWEGHKIVCLHVPAISKTFCFDIATGKWHWRGSVDTNFNDLGLWRAATAIEIYNGTYIGDGLSGAIGKLDTTTYTEFGNPMIGMVQTANLQADRHRVFVSLLELKVEAGVGLPSGQGVDPQIMMRRSVDGGVTWSIAQSYRSLGKEGEYLRRVRWNRQGNGRQMMWQFIISDPVPRTLISAHADATQGM